MLILVRHGQTELNRQGLLLGARLDPPLAEAGREEIAALARDGAFASASMTVSSPLRRARQSAEGLGHPYVTDERWIELDFGELDGTPIEGAGARWTTDPSWAPPGGESLEQLSARVGAALEDLVPHFSVRDVVVVTHVFPIKAALAWALGTDVTTMLRCWIATGSCSRISGARGDPLVVSVNERPGGTTGIAAAPG